MTVILNRTGQRLTTLAYNLRILVKRLKKGNEHDAAWEINSIAQRLETLGADLTARHAFPDDKWRNAHRPRKGAA